jgi:hypothetical protein
VCLHPDHAIRRKLGVQLLRQIEARKNAGPQGRKREGDGENSRLKGISHDAVNQLEVPYFHSFTHLEDEAVTKL